MNVFRGHPSRNAGGFTLVEILTVIVIIGILAGIAIPAVTRALGTAKDAAIRTEIDVMSQAMESYKLKFGDYPPDFTDWAVVERHFRKAFPNIDNNELRILAQFTHYDSSLNRTTSGGPADPRTSTAFSHYPHAIDRAEAIVFCLGGYSQDKKRPFTGEGGPLTLISGATLGTPAGDDHLLYQYNTEREIGFFEFDDAQTSITLLTSSGGIPFAYSDDEQAAIGSTSTNGLGFIFHPDPFPTYRPGSSDRPFVFFNSHSYGQTFGLAPTTATGALAWNSGNSNIDHTLNVYLPVNSSGIEETGVARPYVSNIVDTTPPATINGFSTVIGGTQNTVLEFSEANKFQIISAGRDGNYGGVIAEAVGAAAPGIGVYPSGQFYNPFTTFTPAGPYPSLSGADKYQDDLYLSQSGAAEVYKSQPQLDNVTNFTTRTLGSDLP